MGTGYRGGRGGGGGSLRAPGWRRCRHRAVSLFFNSSLPSPSSSPPSSPEISDFATTGIEDAELWGSGPERGGSKGGCHSCQIINQADPLAQGRMSTAGQSSCNCTDRLLPGELGGAGAGAGGGVTWPLVPLAGPWRVRLGSNTPSPLSHIHRNPLSEPRLGAVGPLRGCDPAAPHLTGCALVPVDQRPEQEPPRARTVSGGQERWADGEFPLTNKLPLIP